MSKNHSLVKKTNESNFLTSISILLYYKKTIALKKQELYLIFKKIVFY